MWLVVFTEEKLTVSPEYAVLGLVRHGDTCGLHLLHKGFVQSGRWHGIAGQDGLRHNKEGTSDNARRLKTRQNWYELALLTVAGVLCCRLAPNVPSNQSFRPGIIIPLSLYLQQRETQSTEVSIVGTLTLSSFLSGLVWEKKQRTNMSELLVMQLSSDAAVCSALLN